MDDSLQAIELLAAARSIELHSELEPDLPPIQCDRMRMIQVLVNLLGNAIKFVPEHGSITVRAVREGHELHLAVIDNGPGIAPDQLAHLFDRYWKGTTGERHGVGLGLYISEGIVRAHGGRIWMASQLGAGSTFHIALPTGPTSA